MVRPSNWRTDWRTEVAPVVNSTSPTLAVVAVAGRLRDLIDSHRPDLEQLVGLRASRPIREARPGGHVFSGAFYPAMKSK